MREAAVVSIGPDKWQELLLVVVVCAQPSASAELLAWCEGKVAEWWLCNDGVLVDALALTATGKTSKFEQRRQPAGSRIANERP